MQLAALFPSRSERSWRWLCLRLLGAFVLCGLAGWLTRELMLQRQLEGLRQQSLHHAEFYRMSLESLLSRNASLPRIIALEDRLQALLANPHKDTARSQANQYLLNVKEGADINAAFLLDRNGLTLAASNFRQSGSYVGNNYGFRPYFSDAIDNGFGVFYGVGATTGDPGYFLAAPIEHQGQRIGAATVKISLDDFEAALVRSGDIVLLVDANGVVFLSSVSQWKYRSLRPLNAAAQQRIENSRQYGRQIVRPLDEQISLTEHSGALSLKLPDVSRQPYLVSSVSTGSLGWSIVLLTRTGQERQNALLGGIAAAFAAAFLLSLVIYFRLSVRRYNERRLAESRLRQVHQQLEQRIAEKTADLQATNASLEERIEALKSTERILRETRDNAVQAGKLAVLGQMAAGISHEVNQPLTALHTFTDNAVDLLERGRLDDVRENLGFIKQMASRMGRIVGEIKHFTRRHTLERYPVSVFGVICQAAMLVESRRKQVEAQLVLPPADESIRVQADSQRLEQVLVNLLLNALDAVAATSNRQVEITVRRERGRVCLAVRDYGAGVSEVALSRLFEPFFTTKSSGQGLGLGLAISRMIVQELGGDIEVRNQKSGGAEFCVILEEA